MYEVRLAEDAQRFFEKADASLQRQIDRCLLQLRADPHRHPRIRKLKGKLSEYHRYRMGDWRVLYRIDDGRSIVWVLAIELRRDAYR